MKPALARLIVAGTALAVAAALTPIPVNAGTIIDDWASVKPESAPVLKPVTVDTKTMALLVLDLVKTTCNDQRRPRCVASIPAIAKLMNEARAKGLTIIHTVTGTNTAAEILPEVAPKAGEELVLKTVADKFVRTDLEKILKDKGITTVIPVGTAAQGAVLYTASQASFRGFKVIVPIDGSTSESLYAEQAVAWLLTHAPGVAQNTTLTKLDMIKF